MTLYVPKGIPSKQILLKENIKFSDTPISGALKIVLLNLMPEKIITETQILRLLSYSSFDINIMFLHAKTHISKNTPKEHLLTFYKTFDDIKHDKIDGLIITGAPIESLEFEDVDYWSELVNIMKWSLINVNSTLYICWAAQAALYYQYGIKKYPLKEKLVGIFKHSINKLDDLLLKNFASDFLAPHSRHTEIKSTDILDIANLEIISQSKEAGVYIVKDKSGKSIYITGHSEYDRLTLKNEYERDIKKYEHATIPKNYFPNNNVKSLPYLTWRKHAILLFNNWITYYVNKNN